MYTLPALSRFVRKASYLIPALILTSTLLCATASSRAEEGKKKEKTVAAAEAAAKKDAPAPALDAVAAAEFPAPHADMPKTDTAHIVIKTSKGDIPCELYPDVAPKHVARIKEFIASKFYSGIRFHRVEPWVIQAGDPVSKVSATAPGVGTGGSQLPNLPLETANAKPNQLNSRGALAMARSADPNSANSQFYILVQDAHFLDGKYTVFGHVTTAEGLKVVDSMEVGDTILSVDLAP